MKAWQYIAIIIALGIFAICLFYPLDIFLPEGWWPIIPDIFLHYPLLWTFNQLTPFLFFMGFFVFGVLFIRGVWKA